MKVNNSVFRAEFEYYAVNKVCDNILSKEKKRISQCHNNF